MSKNGTQIFYDCYDFRRYIITYHNNHKKSAFHFSIPEITSVRKIKNMWEVLT
jgi:hypothetical protein